jgi:hypothetical protein
MSGQACDIHDFCCRTGSRSGWSDDDCNPLTTEQWPSDDQAIANRIAVSMDSWGYPIGLFACNRWVTAETWYPASALIEMLDWFAVDHAYPCWPVNLWLSTIFKLFRP